MAETGKIIIRGAKVNNLKNVDLEIPRDRLIVVTGLSGSGKSSLVFDTLFAEGQRRFAESLSSYARQFLGRMRKPDVERITGLPPAIAVEQKVNVRNPRSTVATTTEIYDYLRVLFARIGRTYSPVSGEEVKCHTAKDVLAYILADGAAGRPAAGAAEGSVDGSVDGAAFQNGPVSGERNEASSGMTAGAAGVGTEPVTESAAGERNEAAEPLPVFLLADLGWKQRKDKVELMLQLKQEGYSRFWSDGPVRIEEMMKHAETEDFPEEVYLLVDRVRLQGARTEKEEEELLLRLHASIATCFSKGGGTMYVVRGKERRAFCDRFEADGLTFRRPDEYMFSFNSPLGACPECGGLGKIIGISEDLVIPDKSLSIYQGAIACWRGPKMSELADRLIAQSDRYEIPIFTPYGELPDSIKELIWNGRRAERAEDSLIGIHDFFKWVESMKYKIQYKAMLSRFSGRTTCFRCKGSRLREDALYVRVGGKNISELLAMDVAEAIAFFEGLSLTENESRLVSRCIGEILFRLRCISDVGLAYLTLDRACNTLSGGEMQRINLVTALGCALTGSMYILDEPSIGLHPRDTDRLIAVLRKLRDMGNTVIVVEHDEEIMRAADQLIDLGPGAGINGGKVVYQGLPAGGFTEKELAASLTLRYLDGRIRRPVRQKHPWIHGITVEGAMEHNLRDLNVTFPLGALTVVTGVSGSGKSSLVGDILYPALFRHFNQTGPLPGAFRRLSGSLDRLFQVEYVDQNPIGKSSRSNAVTYLKVYDDIRKLLADQPYARINDYTPSYFSFNQEGGRCSECQGEGFVKIGMQFMADVTMVCEACGGRRFKPDILQVRYRGKNIDDLLNMSVEEAQAFFGAQPEEEAGRIAARLQYLVDVGLSYIKLGQSSSTLSGGESQRIKLAYFLSMQDRGNSGRKIMFIFDEPTTGLHFQDVEKLLDSFDALLDRGHSIVVVEHHPAVIRAADWVIDLGPDAGAAGGRIVFEGTPEEMLRSGTTITAEYLRKACASC